MRFPGNLNCDLRGIATNLIPFPRIHFFLPSISPISDEEKLNSKIDSAVKQFDRMLKTKY
jgi:hypothetical protein